MLPDLDPQNPNYNRHWMSQVEFERGKFKISLKQGRSRSGTGNIIRPDTDLPLPQYPLTPTGSFTLKDGDSAKNLYDYLEHIELTDPPSVILDARIPSSQANVESQLRRIEFRSRNDSLGPILPYTLQRLVRQDRGGLPIDFEERLWGLMASFHSGLERALQSVVYLGPLRLPESRTLTFSNDTVENVGQLGDRSKEAFFQSSRRAQNTINRWLDRLEIDYRVSVDEMSDSNPIRGTALSMTLKKRGNDPVIRGVYDVGFGISQILPVIIQGVISSNQTICVEQPEIHLHPRLQAHIGDFLIDTALSKRRGPANQWIIETHSELLIQRVQRRIREGVISRDDVSVLYVDPGHLSGSVIKELRLDDSGAFIDGWPRGFFEESFEELLRFNEAGSSDEIAFVEDGSTL
jgi:hypothetical protein